MPISREEFLQRRIDLAVPIAKFLRNDPERAYTAEEVWLYIIDVESRDSTLEAVEEALNRLVSQNRVEQAEFQEQRWYTIVQRRIGFLQE